MQQKSGEPSLDQVNATGAPFVGTEVPAQLDRNGDGALEAVSRESVMAID
ncbi:MAG: hypothetical protein HYX52_05405 [Chloroflexi bacterium]|nr:hypothetical protein [Chloroflexota bacterium]